jgi:hypothetical protein
VTITRPEEGGEEHQLSPDDCVRFEETEGMKELIGQSSEFEDVRRLQFRIKCDPRNFSESASVSRSDCGNEEFQSKTLSFLSFVDALNGTSMRDITIGRDSRVILGFIVAQRILERQSGNLAVVSAKDLLAAANELNGEIRAVDEIGEPLLREFVYESDALSGRHLRR